MTESFIQQIQDSLKIHWDYPAFSDYKQEPVYYSQVARQIARTHIFFEQCDVKKGDKIALCGRNSANWATAYFAIISYGAVCVPLLHEFKAESIHHLVNHSEAKILFVGDVVWENIEQEQMPDINAIILLPNFSLVYSKTHSYSKAYRSIDKHFLKKYPRGFRRENVKYEKEDREDLALINYTSGTTSFSKGVMLSYKNIQSNVLLGQEVLPSFIAGCNLISMLPLAHMYGMTFELVFEFMQGGHIHFLTKAPSPKIILEEFQRIKPDLIISVPLIIEKIYKNKIKPVLDKTMIKLMLSTPVLDNVVKGKILKQINESFGSNFYEIVVGGAAMNQDVEHFFKKIGFKYTIGYGMTETAPLICYEDWSKHKLNSCGKVISRMQVKIDSPDPANIVGEIHVKGDNVMIGYYKNEEATKAAFTEDGWLKTGDLGVLDKDGNLFIKGRSKNMILGPSGQNIYPEEIEDKLNSIEYIMESIVLEREGKIVALVYLDIEKLDDEKIDIVNSKSIMRDIKEQINSQLPAYSQISYIYIQEEEFEKTPKRSIKRYLYTKV